jgi:hypothetical protein
LDLRRLATSVRRRSSIYGDFTGSLEEEIDAKRGASLYLDLLNNLEGIIASRRAATLGDVAAQLVVAFSATSYLDVHNMPKREAERYRRMLRLIVLSALPIVAPAGKVDLAELDGDYLLGFTDCEFPPVTMDTPSPKAEPQPEQIRW